MEDDLISKSDCDKRLADLQSSTAQHKQSLENEIAFLKEQYESQTLMFKDAIEFIEKMEQEFAVFKESNAKSNP